MKAEDNEFPSVLFAEQASAPTTPGVGLWRAYFKSDGLYVVNDAGTETGPFGAAEAGGTPTFHGCKALRTTTQSIPNNTATAIALNATEDFDTDAFHDTTTNNTRITIPTGLGGYYSLKGSAEWAANTTGSRILLFAVNGTALPSYHGRERLAAAASGNTVAASASVDLHLSAGDYVELQVVQNSSAALDINGGVLSVALLGT